MKSFRKLIVSFCFDFSGDKIQGNLPGDLLLKLCNVHPKAAKTRKRLPRGRLANQSFRETQINLFAKKKMQIVIHSHKLKSQTQKKK